MLVQHVELESGQVCREITFPAGAAHLVSQLFIVSFHVLFDNVCPVKLDVTNFAGKNGFHVLL